VLCLASGGGQQGPILAAAGARVTVFDNSPQQLAQDRFVARREGLTLETVEGDMRDLSVFADVSFDLIVHP
jgi:2-polyprenyl-3-methyl-5-hydroxy-6-metoxy-1,4-benzoquinol methylase